MNKALQRVQTKERVQRYRERQKDTENVTLDVTPPPIVYALVTKRKKLQDICKALDHRSLHPRLYYGCGDFSISFDTVEDLLEATREKK